MTAPWWPHGSTTSKPAPAWIDDAMVAQGQDVFREWSLDIVTSLFCASLPFAYAAAQGVEVLERISQLADPETVARRIAETGQMLLDVSEPGALAPGGPRAPHRPGGPAPARGHPCPADHDSRVR